MITKNNKRIAFDIGDVLCHIDFKPMITEMIIQGLCHTEEDVLLFCKDIQTFHDMGNTDMDLALRTHYRGIASKKINIIKEAWKAIAIPSKPAMDLLTELIAEGAQVALLSNIGLDHAEYLSEICAPQFNYCIKHFSCFVGARKPTKLFYQSFIMDNSDFEVFKFQNNTTDGKGRRGLFFDDRIENVQAAKPYLDSHYFKLTDFDSDEIAIKKLIEIIQE